MKVRTSDAGRRSGSDGIVGCLMRHFWERRSRLALASISVSLCIPMASISSSGDSTLCSSPSVGTSCPTADSRPQEAPTAAAMAALTRLRPYLAAVEAYRGDASEAPAEKGWHRIEVSLEHARGEIKARRGYLR